MAVSALPMEYVRVVKSATCGRSLVYTSKFAPGQCILEELPYAYTLKNDRRGSYCDFCLKNSSTLKKCTGCKHFSYCNTSCQKGDWARCHKQYCKILKKHPDPAIHLLSQVIQKQRQPPLCTQDDEDCFPTTLDQLESHHEKLSDTSLHTMWPQLKILLSCIEGDVPTGRSSLLKMYGAINCNNFSICDNYRNSIGDGIYLRASMANHSCDLNCEQVFDGRTLQLRTIKDFEEGEECTISYVDVINPAKERQAELEKKYHFTCKCVKCIEEINELGPDDDLLVGGELHDLKEAWEQIQVAAKSKDRAKVLQLCAPYLKPMDSIPANHHLLVKLRYKAFEAFMVSQKWEEAANIGRLNTEPYRHHYGPYSACLGIYLLTMSPILLNLERLKEARKYFKEAEKVLEVTHGRQHSLMLTAVQNVLDRCRERAWRDIFPHVSPSVCNCRNMSGISHLCQQENKTFSVAVDDTGITKDGRTE